MGLGALPKKIFSIIADFMFTVFITVYKMEMMITFCEGLSVCQIFNKYTKYLLVLRSLLIHIKYSHKKYKY